jgi:hypothetical protein
MGDYAECTGSDGLHKNNVECSVVVSGVDVDVVMMRRGVLMSNVRRRSHGELDVGLEGI